MKMCTTRANILYLLVRASSICRLCRQQDNIVVARARLSDVTQYGSVLLNFVGQHTV